MQKVRVAWAAGTTITGQTILAAKLAPPAKPETKLVWSTALVAASAALSLGWHRFVAAILTNSTERLLGYILLVVSAVLVLVILDYRDAREKWQAKMDDWRDRWVCLACGTVSDAVGPGIASS